MIMLLPNYKWKLLFLILFIMNEKLNLKIDNVCICIHMKQKYFTIYF